MKYIRTIWRIFFSDNRNSHGILVKDSFSDDIYIYIYIYEVKNLLIL